MKLIGKGEVYMKKIRYVIAIIVIAVGAIVCAGFFSSSIEVETIDVQKQYIKDSFKENAVVKKGEAIEVLAEVSGKVQEIYVNKNQFVKKGDKIALLDKSDYEYELKLRKNNIVNYETQITETLNNEKNQKRELEFSLEQLNEQIKGLEIKKKSNDVSKVLTVSPEEYIETLKINLELAKSSYNYAKNTFENINELYNAGTVSKAEFDKIQNELDNAKAAMDTAQNQYDFSVQELEKLEINDSVDTYFYKYQDEEIENSINNLKIQAAALEDKMNTDYSSDTVKQLENAIESEKIVIEQLESNINKCTITAKETGYIKELPIENVSMVSAGMNTVLIQKDAQATLEADILTSSVPYLNVVDKVILTQKLRSDDIVMEGTIKEIYDFAEKGVSALGLDEYRVKVIIEISDNIEELKDGYELEAEFVTFEQEEAIALANSSIFEVEGKKYVFKVENGKAVKTEVQTGHKTNTKTVILSGVTSGDKIIYNADTEGLYDGIEVKQIEK